MAFMVNNPVNSRRRMDYTLTSQNVAHQLIAIRARAHALTDGLDEAALNWQPDEGRGWSIAQCLDHLALTDDLYGQALDAAMDSAPKATTAAPARPNLLGRGLIWAVEPPARIRVKALSTLMPPSAHVPATLLRRYDGSLNRLSLLADRAMTIDASRTRYANPLADGVKSFNIATGIMVMLAHHRRHLEQAEKVRAAWSAQSR